MNTGVGYSIDSYGEVQMIKGSKQGRGLFFAVVEDRLILLLAYKKETQKAPRRLIELAVERKKKFMNNE